MNKFTNCRITIPLESTIQTIRVAQHIFLREYRSTFMLKKRYRIERYYGRKEDFGVRCKKSIYPVMQKDKVECFICSFQFSINLCRVMFGNYSRYSIFLTLLLYVIRISYITINIVVFEPFRYRGNVYFNYNFLWCIFI